MGKFCKRTFRRNGIEVKDFDGIMWLNEKNIEEQLGHAHLVAITRRYSPEYKKHRYEFVDNPKKQPNRIFLRGGVAVNVIKDCRTPKSCKVKRRLGFKLHDVFNKQ